MAFTLLPELERHLGRVVTIDMSRQVFGNVLVRALRDLVDAIRTRDRRTRRGAPSVAEVL